jgi:hypothetical protein
MDTLTKLDMMLKKDKPEGATTIYVVSWSLRYDSDNFAMISNKYPTTIMQNSKKFITAEIAEQFKSYIQKAFKTLGYSGNIFMSEDYCE